MSLLTDYGLDTPARILPILVLSIRDRNQEKAMNVIHIHKVIRYFEYLRQKSEIEFSNFKLGAVSYELEENIQTLKDCGLIHEIDNNRLVLSEIGESAAEELETKLDKDEIPKLAFAKKQLNDLPSEELMFFIYKLIPETQEHSTEFSRLDRKKDLLVRNLFLKGRINSVTAAKWLGIDEKEFIESLSE